MPAKCLLLTIISALVLTGTVNAALIDQPITGATAPGWVLAEDLLCDQR